jgi:hypothetical protein
MTGALHEDLCTFIIIHRSFLLRMRNVLGKSCRELQKNTFLCSITFFPENRAVYEIMWKNIAEPGRPHMTRWRMRIACWTAKATNTHSRYVILLAFLLQQWLHERATVLRYTYIACLTLLKTNSCTFVKYTHIHI